MLAVVSKPVDFFRPDPGNPRKHFPEEELRLLGASLRKKQLVPLLARTNGVIVDGERRWRAAPFGGVTHLEAILLDDTVGAAEVKEIQLITALHRADLRPFEVFCGCQDWLKAHPGATAKDLAKAIDRSEASVSVTLSLARCIKVVQEGAEAGQIGVKDWHAISQHDDAKQAEMLMARLQGAATADIKRARKPSTGVRTQRVKCEMGSGVCVTLAGVGQGLTLEDVIETLADLLKEARKAKEQGLDSKTFTAVLKDKAKAG